MKKERAGNLTKERMDKVLELLDVWRGKLTWELLIVAIEESEGIKYSRFTFQDYPEIANAFKVRKAALKGTMPRERAAPRDEQVRAALATADRAKAKAERLEKENQLLLEQFVRWAFNAQRRNVSMDQLNAPLPKPNRDQTKGAK
ncbi:MAG: hypothetical protein NVSMB57_07750 [Actinomycetota bacterium]